MSVVCDARAFIRALALLAALVAMALPPGAYAQSSVDLILGTDLAIELSPAHPEPGERVYATARSTLIDLSSLTLSWSKNGEKMESGVGLTEFDIAAGNLGSETRLTLQASEGGIPFATAEAVIRPTALELLWEADSYVSPFYRGRALPSAGTNLRLQAIPRFIRTDGSAIATKDLIFTWKRNGYVIQSASGRGKSSARLESPSLYGTDMITVEVKTQGGELASEAGARVESQSPHVALYQNHPVFGTMYYHALSGRAVVSETEATFSAVPFFAPATSPDDRSLTYQWKINGVDILNNETNPSMITINAEKSPGEAAIELFLTHSTDLYLNATAAWDLLFSAKDTNAAFGTSQ